MTVRNTVNALKMATAQKINTKAKTIHHSDRGLQYCSKEYVRLTAKNNIRLSMTENSDPYENALAERMNRTIKEEFGINRKLKTKKQAIQLVRESIYLYNTKRPHLSLNMRTPQQVYKNENPEYINAIGILIVICQPILGRFMKLKIILRLSENDATSLLERSTA